MVTVVARESALEDTQDRLLGGRVVLRQPRRGYRVAIDSVLLAAAVPLKPGDRAIDLGCGVGAVSLCLLSRQPELQVFGVERQAVLAGLARRNAAENGWADRFTVEELDFTSSPEGWEGQFDHAVLNPPYHDAARQRPSPNAVKAAANHTAPAALPAALASARVSLKHKGRVTLVHRADALSEILEAMVGFGEIAICPLWPKAGRPAKRVIVSARKGMKSGSAILPGLVLHEADGAYTPTAHGILTEGRELELLG